MRFPKLKFKSEDFPDGFFAVFCSRSSHVDRQSEHRNFWFKAAGLENEIIMENERRILKEWGLGVETLYGKELEKEIKSPRCIAGLKTKQGAILNPAKLARGMKKIVENMDVEIRERSLVSKEAL